MKKNHIIFVLLFTITFLLTGCNIFTAATPLPEGETISEIQGAGHISPLKNRPVYNVHGIVTAIRADGFYMQDPNPDDDPATSEAVFVYGAAALGVRIGDEVLVNAVVIESDMGDGYLTITQLKNPHVEVISTGNNLPEPMVIGGGGRMPPSEVIDDDTLGKVGDSGEFDPQNDGIDFYESLESMRVQVNDAVAVSGTSQYKEIAVVGDLGAHAGVMTPRGGLVVQSEDFNPERIILDDAMRNLPLVTTGDRAEGPIIGVMDYTYGNFKLQPTESVSFIDGDLTPEGPLAAPADGQIRVVNYNVLNLSAQDKNRAAVLAEQIVDLMTSPDIIGLQEIQDNDGSISSETVSADETYHMLIDAIAAQGGPAYGFVNIDPERDQDGGVPGGNIRVGFLYRLDRGISLAEAPNGPGDAVTATDVLNIEGELTLSVNPGRIDPTNVAFADSRKPMIVTFLIDDTPLYIINNHFNSKGGDSGLFGEYQPPVLESEVQRLLQAEVLHDFVAQMLAVDPAVNILVMGDLNDFQFSPPVDLLEESGLNNLMETLPVSERYSYVYDGNSQTLDQMLVSDGLLEQVVEYDVLHINSEFDYQHRFSDHDPVTVVIELD
ncbi:MAG: endonuclease/exonuclease/phosphatase family protein [Chloroflexota bacterium]|nr:endonuclease/exonuclease/phosphatase family protein [Chloroflexota bacterium]